MIFSTFPEDGLDVISGVEDARAVLAGAKMEVYSGTAFGLEEVMASPIKAVSNRLKVAYGRPKFRTLLVDEDPSDVRYYYGVLRAIGHEVVVCDSYAEALSLLERENFDMAVVGQGSPAFEGRKVLARAREINEEMPVLVVARTLDIDCYLEAMEIGAADYLERCAAPRDFMRAVDAHLQLKSAA